MRNVLSIIVVLAAIPCCARTITVDNNAPADFNNIQAAIIDANHADTVEIQPGTYTGPGNTDIDFLGKQITVTSKAPNDPNTVAQTIIDCNNTARAFLFQTNETPNSILNGLTIINGYSSGHGGAIYCSEASPVIRNCTMTKNVASWAGAIRCEDGSNVVIEDCIFTDNSAKGAGAIYYYQSNATIERCIFRDNYSTNRPAGAVLINQANGTITDCIFQANSAFPGDYPDRSGGGALRVSRSQVSVANCLFVGNSALYGGAIISDETEMTLANCTFAHNYAHAGNTLYTHEELYSLPSEIRIENSIVWDDPHAIVLEDDSSVLVTFSDIQGAGPGYGNIHADPCFVNPGYWDPNGTPQDANDDYYVPGDYHLKSQAGRWNPTSKSWAKDHATSPCIDAADPNSPLAKEPFPNGGRINMGAYGATAQASKSYFAKPPCDTIVAGDINGDCIVNYIDFALMSAHWHGQYYKSYPLPAKWPQPLDGQENVSTNVYLGWSADCFPPEIRRGGPPGPTSSCAASHDIYLGTDYAALIYASRTSPQYKANEPAERFLQAGYFPEQLHGNTIYYWRIDEIGANGEITTGHIWSFKTGPRPPDQATNPDPPNDANDLPQPIVLSWSSGPDALSHDVYLGHAPRGPLNFIGNQTSTTFQLGPLIPGAKYCWRIDEVGIIAGRNFPYMTTGEIWSFTTADNAK